MNWRKSVKILSLFGAAMISQACSPVPKPTLPVSGLEGSTITVKVVPEDRPKFEREYTATLDVRATIKVTIRTGWRGDRDKSGELDQPNGRWILFDPDRIADKIIDPTLVPLVENAVSRISALDKQYMDSQPSVFTDEGGIIWRKD